MYRSTSIEAYNQIKAEGLLSKLRFSVYECIFRHGPLTQGECVDLLQKELNCGNNSGTIASRFAELKHLGVIVEVGKRPCKLTSRNCYEWNVTNSLPVEYERKTKDQMIKELKEEIASLRSRMEAIRTTHPEQLILL